MELLKLHREDKHPRAVGGSTTEDSHRKVKFPQPGIDQGQPLEVWETFLTQWAEYKKQMHVSLDNVAGQLISVEVRSSRTAFRGSQAEP